MAYYLSPTSYAGSAFAPTWDAVFGPNEVSGQPDSTTVVADTVGGYPHFVDVRLRGRQFALWLSGSDSASTMREDINRMLDVSRAKMDKLVVTEDSGSARFMWCKPIQVTAHPQLAKSFIVRMEAADPTWYNDWENIQSGSVSLAAPLQRGFMRKSASAQMSSAIVYDTTTDTDGGAWRDSPRARASSWYRETGSPFPRRAMIEWATGSAGGDIDIVDLEDHSTYMSFVGDNDNIAKAGQPNVVAKDGSLYFTKTGIGIVQIDFLNDKGNLIGFDTQEIYDGDVSQRNDGLGWKTNDDGLRIRSAAVNDFYATTVLGDTRVVAGTNNNTTIWSVQSGCTLDYGDGDSDDYLATWLSPNGDLWAYNEQEAELEMYVATYQDTADIGTEDFLFTPQTVPALWGASPMPVVTATIGVGDLSVADGQSDVVFVGHDEGVTRLDFNDSASQLSTVQYMTASYISEIMPAEARGMWPFHEALSGSLAAAASIQSTAATIISSCVTQAALYSPCGFGTGSGVRGPGWRSAGNYYFTSRITSGCNTDTLGNILRDTSTNFFDAGVEAGDEVVNWSTGSKATVTRVTTSNLTLTADIFTASPVAYDVQSGGFNLTGNAYFGLWVNYFNLLGSDSRWLIAGEISISGCRAYRIANTTACDIKFDVSDTGVSYSSTACAPSLLRQDEWNHIWAIHDADNDKMVVWLNGVSGASVAHSTGIYDSGGPLVICGRYTASDTVTEPSYIHFSEPIIGTWSGSPDWDAMVRRIYEEGKRALDLSGSDQSRLYGTSSCVRDVAVSRDGSELVVGTAGSGAVSFMEWGSSWRTDEYDNGTSDTDSDGSALDFDWVERVSYSGDLLVIGGCSAGVSRTWVEEHFPRALAVENTGNVDTDVSVDLRPTMARLTDWRKARRLEIVNRSDSRLRNYPVMLEFDTATEVSDKDMRSDGYDLRVLFDGVERDRWLYNPDDSATQVWFNVDMEPRQRREGLLIYGNPYAPAQAEPVDGAPAFAWNTGSATNTNWPYVDFGSWRADQTMAWRPTQLLPPVDAGSLDLSWVARTQGGTGGIGDVKTLRLTLGADADDAMDRGDSATYRSTGNPFLGKLSGTGSRKWNTGFMWRGVAIAAGAKILSARLRVKCKQELSEGWIGQQRGDANAFWQWLVDSPDNGDRGEIRLKIYADSDASAAALASGCRPGQRTLTSASVDWDVHGRTDPTLRTHGGGWVDGVYYESPNFASVVQEVIDDANWATGQDMAIIVKDDGSFGSGKELTFFEAPGKALRNAAGDIVREGLWFPAHRKLANQKTELVIEYAEDIVNVPMSDVDPWNDIAVGHYNAGIRAGETPNNAWMLEVPSGIKQVKHAGQFRVMSRLSAPESVTATIVSAEANNVAWTTGSKFYTVSALNAKGETTLSASTSHEIVSGETAQAIRVTWSGVRKATNYRVYRGTTIATYDTMYEVDGKVSSFLDKNDPGDAAVTPSDNTATVNNWQLQMRNQHGKLVPFYQTTASSESKMSGYGAFVSHIYSFESGGGTFGNELSASTAYTYWPSSPSAGDRIYFGSASKFYGLFFNVGTAGNYTNSASWQFYDGSWTTFTPNYVDLEVISSGSSKPWHTAGSGSVGWDDGDMTSWAKTSINSVSNYWVRVELGTGTVTTNPAQATVVAGPATTPTDAMTFPSQMVVMALEPDTQLASKGQGAFSDRVELTLDEPFTPSVTTGSEFDFYGLDATVRAWSDYEEDAEKARVRNGMVLDGEWAVLDSASGVAVSTRTGNRLSTARDGARRRLLRLTPGSNVVQVQETGGTRAKMSIRHRDRWN